MIARWLSLALLWFWVVPVVFADAPGGPPPPPAVTEVPPPPPITTTPPPPPIATVPPPPPMIAVPPSPPAPSERPQPASEPPPNRHALTINPLMAMVGAFTARLGVPGVLVAGRYHHSLSNRVALTVAPNFAYADILTLHHYAIGVKVGPRFARRYLVGWFAFPNVLLGVGWSRAQGEHIATALMIGGGAELGYAWHWWKHMAFELGAGLFYGKTVGDTAPGAAIEGGLFPVVNLSVGYAW